LNQEKIRHSQEQNKPSGQTDSSESILLCYFLILICLTWGAVLWQSEQDRRSTENQIVNINDNLAQAYEDHTKNALIRIEKVLEFLKTDYEAHGAVTPSVHLLVKQQIDDPLINQSVVTDAAGNLLTTALDSRQNLANAPQFLAHIQRDTGRSFIGQPRIGGISGKESVHVSRRLNNPDGSFAGMVSVALNPQYFTGFYQSMRLSEGHTVWLFGLDGAIRARYPAGAILNPKLLFAALERQPTGHYREGNIFYSYRRLPHHPLGVLVGVSGDSALAAYRQRRTTYFGGAVGVSLLMFGFTALRLRSLKQKRMLQARYRALMEQSFDALVLVEMKTQQVVELNPKFSELFGYSLPADAPLYVNQFLVDTQSNLDHLYNVILPQQRHLPPEARLFRHKRGMLLYVERVGSVIDVDGKDIFLASMRDMTAERRRQAALSRDVEFARTVQRELLPSIESSDSVEIRTLYYPKNFVNGDAYHLEWQQQGTLLRGFLIDVSGHGMATALQTTALSVLLRETAANGLSLLEQIKQLNTQAAKYFSDDSYAAILAFELDLPRRELRYVGAGITQFYAYGIKIETPGMFVGLWDDAEFSSGSLPLAAGDTLFFLTDGFTDALAKTDAAIDVAMLERLGESGELGDDATGVCLRIGGFA
jgi:PAS domain S-box-containing protein